MEDIEEVETITPEIAGKCLHSSAECIRAGLRQERFPFGVAIQGKTGQWRYIIIKSKFLEYVDKKEKKGVENNVMCN
ncbi:MAG: hypothetical protein HFJ48_06270 [Clostridia bacterium]|nr:hypothetical protein [Clostridia bacterium]